MNREDVIRMARKAGFENSEYGLNCTPGMYAYNMEIVERFAALVAAAEREACARVCDERAMKNEKACDGLDDEDATSLRSAAWQMSVCAAEIRARGAQ